MQMPESLEFRKAARDNCYRYGNFYVYTDRVITLEDYKFPKYHSKSALGAVEKLLTLINSLGANATGNDPSEKLSKPLPGVEWSGDELSVTLTLQGKMYFTSYREYKVYKRNIRKQFLAEGWKQIVFSNVVTYKPMRDGKDALYNEDPVDAAGMAMLTSSIQHTADQMKMLKGYDDEDPTMYAEGYARYSTMCSNHSTLGGIGANLQAAVDAFYSNLNSAMVVRWNKAGRPLELLIEGVVQKKGLNYVLQSAQITEDAYVVDDTSGGYVYPTEMSVSLELLNMYGALLVASSAASPSIKSALETPKLDTRRDLKNPVVQSTDRMIDDLHYNSPAPAESTAVR